MSGEDVWDEKKKGMFASIESREVALKAVKDYSSGFYELVAAFGRDLLPTIGVPFVNLIRINRKQAKSDGVTAK